jgi:uncharacterized protein
VIVADTGAIVALVDADDRHHRVLRALFDEDPDSWVLPWAILPEVDYLIAAHVGQRAADTFLSDLARGHFRVEWGNDGDLRRAHELCRRYPALKLGLVDGAVISVAERLGARSIATVDLRHFAAVQIRGNPRLVPRDRS